MTHRAQQGLTLIEMVFALAMSAVILLAAQALWSQFASNRLRLDQQHAITEQGHFAMRRMVNAVARTEGLMVPGPDVAATPWREHVREQTIPASPPETGSSFANAVLVVMLDNELDVDRDGLADADNDGDGRINEDPGANIAGNTGGGGIVLLDDNGDGIAAIGTPGDDDEDGVSDEDPVNGLDDDGDGRIDEDFGVDRNGDGSPGFAGVDDDGDGTTDEGPSADDDEDGTNNEDWIDMVGFYLQGGQLVEMYPDPPSQVPDGDEAYYSILTLAENVTALRFERIETAEGVELVDIQMTLTDGPSTITLGTVTRVGGQR